MPFSFPVGNTASTPSLLSQEGFFFLNTLACGGLVLNVTVLVAGCLVPVVINCSWAAR